MTYYNRIAALDSDSYPVTKTVDRILNNRSSLARTTTPEPRSIMRDVGAQMVESRVQNMRDRLAREIDRSPPSKTYLTKNSLTPTRSRYVPVEVPLYETYSPQKSYVRRRVAPLIGETRIFPTVLEDHLVNENK